MAGTTDGRVYAYSESKKASTLVGGTAHSNHVSGLTTSAKDGKAYSIGFDDHVREISGDGSTFLSVVYFPSFRP